ncbi:abortive phage infection protein [Metabacillus sp. 113a]|uniref:abortive phage infection protein n=1 Tax=Metabacillus sp. 113a TaxID=3404706 RepID=UPI003CF2D92B
MDPQTIHDSLDQLKSGALAEYPVPKDLFLQVREILVSREDFKHFRGIAKHNGYTVYTYLEAARS